MGTNTIHREIVVPKEGEGMRVDAFLASFVTDFPRSAASLDSTRFTIDTIEVKKSRKVHQGELVTVTWTEEHFDSVVPQDLPLCILYEDDDILVINKQQSLVVHPGSGNWEGTVVNALVYRYGEDFAQDLQDHKIRPGIVHRLDKETSGVMIIAKNRVAHLSLTTQFKERTTEKYYIALVKGTLPKKRGVIETHIIRDPNHRKKFCVGGELEGKHAKTGYLVLRDYQAYSLVRLRLFTGRTHQIRVHLTHLGTPIVGDPLYGRKDQLVSDASMMLHALSLSIEHPSTHQRMKFVAPLPQRFKDVIDIIRTR